MFPNPLTATANQSHRAPIHKSIIVRISQRPIEQKIKASNASGCCVVGQLRKNTSVHKSNTFNSCMSTHFKRMSFFSKRFIFEIALVSGGFSGLISSFALGKHPSISCSSKVSAPPSRICCKKQMTPLNCGKDVFQIALRGRSHNSKYNQT